MKFDYVIGNPPYQEEAVGDQKTMTPPVYHKFLDAAYEIGNRVMMVHPGRFLFGAGRTPDEWNQKMLADPHLKVVHYEPDGNKVFPGTDIKGGIVVTYRDSDTDFGAINVFIPWPELRSINAKVGTTDDNSLSNIFYSGYTYKFTDLFYNECPEEAAKLTLPHIIETNTMANMPNVFFDECPNDGRKYVQIYGLIDQTRVYKYVLADYINEPGNLYKFKVFVPKANGSGMLGEVISTPVVGQPVVGHNRSFLSIGAFDTEAEANACLKYIKTKFVRVLVGILKVTQDTKERVWKYVPMQDFTSGSDIDWSQDVAGIDRQLYKKYGLDDDEIAFIEEKVRAM